MDDYKTAGTCFCGGAIQPPRRLYCSYLCLALATRASSYGLGGADYAVLLATQGDACALCFRPFDAEGCRPVIDHDHHSGVVRGLLCQGCNLRIGFFERGHPVFPKDTTPGEFALRASRYLNTRRE